MSAFFLLILLAIAIFLSYSSRKKKSNTGILLEKSFSNSECIIRTYDMSREELENAIEKFLTVYSEQIEEDKPKISKEGDTFKLSFGLKNDFLMMSFWVNYLVYSDESKECRFTVRGWYTFGEATNNGVVQPFSNQTVMLYVDKDDKDFDNVNFVTPDGKQYHYSFADNGGLTAIESGSEEYKNK